MRAIDSAHSLENSLEHEQTERLFYEKIDTTIKNTLEEIRTKFEQNPVPENNLDFHNSSHTESVIDRTEIILRTIQKNQPELVSEHAVALGRFAAANHDTVQKWGALEMDVPGFEQKKIFRNRQSGDNEATSAELAVVKLKKVNRETSQTIFTLEDEKTINEAIMGTVPGYDLKLKTVIQPNLLPESNLTTYALALADIGSAGMDGPEAFKEDGNNVFKEENLDIAKALQEKQPLSTEDKAFYQARILQWTDSQADFALGRKIRLDKELPDQLNFETRMELVKLFDKFDVSISAAKTLSEKRITMSFEELIKDVGY